MTQCSDSRHESQFSGWENTHGLKVILEDYSIYKTIRLQFHNQASCQVYDKIEQWFLSSNPGL